MALITCQECGREMSSDAAACPACGKPNKPAVDKSKDGRQSIGCALMIAGALTAAFIQPVIGLILLVVGLVFAALNTRLK